MQIHDYKQYFKLDYNQFVRENKVNSRQISKNVRYEKLTDVTRVNLHDDQFFFFKDGRLQLIYISDDELVNKLWGEFKNLSTTPEKTVRSRAGKTANQYIFANEGITLSTTNDDVHFMEIYPPCALEYYLEHVYQDPGLFIR